MDEKQQRLFRQINIEETRKSLTHLRSMLNRIKAHTDAVDDPALNLELINLDANVDRALKLVWMLERAGANANA